jgi:hypothetical protein
VNWPADTPAVKATYSIAVTAPAPLSAVCSGTFTGTNFEDDGQLTWKYIQRQPIPVCHPLSLFESAADVVSSFCCGVVWCGVNCRRI